MDIYKQLLDSHIPKENILLEENMGKHTSFQTGGNAKFFVKAYSIPEIQSIINVAKENHCPYFVLGNGTNLLVKEEGYPGIILQIKMDHIQIEKTQAIVECGVKNMALAIQLANANLSGFEFASGIPGTIGGAVKMNAGAYGQEMKDIVKEVTYLDENGQIHTLQKEDCQFSYRHSIFSKQKWIILSAILNLAYGNQQEIKQKMKELEIQRKEKQPLEYPSAGSTFKRGENYITAKLIDTCGLKGYQIGGAQVSTKHAGFIINQHHATPSDIIQLIQYVQKVVKEKTGENIELEIEII